MSETNNGAHPHDHNQIADMTALKNAIVKHEKLGEKMATLKGEYMAECKEIREDQAQIIRDAAEKGVVKRVLKAVLKRRELTRKIEGVAASLDEDLADELQAYEDTVTQWNLPL